MRIAHGSGHALTVGEPIAAKRFGHQVLVANPRKIRAHERAAKAKNDRNDAEQLARLAAYRSQAAVVRSNIAARSASRI